MTTGQLLDELVGRGSSRANARQIISRRYSQDGLWRSDKLQLPRRERLIAPKEEVGSPKFQSCAAALLSDCRPGIARLLRALSSRRAVLRSHAAMLVAAPLAKRKRVPSFAEELEALAELGVLLDGRDTSFERVLSGCLPGSDQSIALGISLQSRRQAEIALAKIVAAHLRRLGILSWGGVTVANPSPGYVPFNDLPFCATGYSWLKPLIRQGKSGKAAPTPMVFHVRATRCNQDDVSSLLDRVSRAGFNARTRLPILAFIAAPDFDSRAWNQAKKNGFLAANLNDLFGNMGLEAMVAVEEIMKGIVGNPERLDPNAISGLCTLLGELKANPILADLRSLSLESVSGLILRSQCWEDVQLGVTVPHRQTTRDVDVYGSRELGEVAKLIECKAAHAHKDLEPGDVHKFFTETVPAFLRSTGRERNVQKCEAEIWTTGTVGRAAKDCMHAIECDHRVQTRLLDGAELVQSVPDRLGRAKELLRVISLAI